MKHKGILAKFWMDHYLNKGLCSLCGNNGIIDTTGRAKSPAGVEAGRVNWCICPNGIALRLGTKLDVPSARE